MKQVNHVLQLKTDFLKGDSNTSIISKDKKYLSSKNKPKIKTFLKFSTILNEKVGNEDIKINNIIIRKKLLELTLYFLEPFHAFFDKQQNVGFIRISSDFKRRSFWSTSGATNSGFSHTTSKSKMRFDCTASSPRPSTSTST